MSQNFLGFLISATFISNIVCLLFPTIIPYIGFSLLVIIIYGNIHFLTNYKRFLNKKKGKDLLLISSGNFFWHLLLPLFIIFYYNVFEYPLTFNVFFIILFIMIFYILCAPVKKIYKITKLELFINIFCLWVLIFIFINHIKKK